MMPKRNATTARIWEKRNALIIHKKGSALEIRIKCQCIELSHSKHFWKRCTLDEFLFENGFDLFESLP